jgi:hypothetical protein
VGETQRFMGASRYGMGVTRKKSGVTLAKRGASTLFWGERVTNKRTRTVNETWN